MPGPFRTLSSGLGLHEGEAPQAPPTDPPAADTCRMAKKPEPPKPIIWNVYKIAKKTM
jgi:hypothetical protein